eukprot:6537234-Prymnesium_polylepis.1
MPVILERRGHPGSACTVRAKEEEEEEEEEEDEESTWRGYVARARGAVGSMPSRGNAPSVLPVRRMDGAPSGQAE